MTFRALYRFPVPFIACIDFRYENKRILKFVVRNDRSRGLMVRAMDYGYGYRGFDPPTMQIFLLSKDL